MAYIRESKAAPPSRRSGSSTRYWSAAAFLRSTERREFSAVLSGERRGGRACRCGIAGAMCMLLQILLPLRTRRDRHRRLCPLGGFGSQRKKLTLRRCLIGGIAPMDREESIDHRALMADARSVHHLPGLIHCELSLLAHHTSYKDDVDWPARQGCVVQASGVMRASGVWGGDAQATARERARLFVSSKHSTTRQPGVRVARPSARATGVWRHATGKDQHGRIRKPGRTLQGEAVVNECGDLCIFICVIIYISYYIYV